MSGSTHDFVWYWGEKHDLNDLIADEIKKWGVIETNKITVPGYKLIDDDGHGCYKYIQIYVDMKVIATRCTLGTGVKFLVPYLWS